jgi:5-methylcytosine-specific restriction endonuclease McrA
MARRKIASQREAKRLRSKGMSLRAIARALGVSLSSVSLWTRGVVSAAPVPTTTPRATDPVETRRCGTCEAHLPMTEFHKGQGACKGCRAAYMRERGELHIQQMRAARERRRAEARRYVLGLLATASCADCGLTDSLVLEFDHVGDKTADISLLVHEGYALRRVEAEVACCEIVCANCHRRRTNMRAGGSWRLDLEGRVPADRPLKRRNLRFLLDHLRKASCAGCGESDIVVLEFDHVGPKRGKGVVSLAFDEYGLEYLRAEVEQCEIRCANCHRRETIRRQPTHLRHHLLEPP